MPKGAKSMTFCVDASVIVASILPHEPAHEESRIFMERWEREIGSLIVPIKLRAADAFYVALARRENLPLITLDKEIIKISQHSHGFQAMRPEQANS